MLHAVVPRRQGLPATLHVAPTEQSLHAPALHTRSWPQVVPAGTLVLVSMHVGVPPVQTSAPVWQRLVGSHAAPAWQATHAPAWQTMLVPQLMPFGLLSLSVHTGAPVVQTMVPTRQGLPGTSHAMPAWHAAHVPLLQAMLVPHSVPLACRSGSSPHDIAPSMHTNAPLWQALAGTHAPPAMHVGASGLTPPSLPAVPVGLRRCRRCRRCRRRCCHHGRRRRRRCR